MFDWLFWNPWAGVAIAAGLCTALAGYFDHRRTKRKSIESVGFVPWSVVMFVALMITFVAALLTWQNWS